MKLTCRAVLRRSLVLLLACGGLSVLGSHGAEARVFIGFGVPLGIPYYPPPPIYYPPPAYYPPPPPVVYAPPPAYSPPSPAYPGQTCYAGPYTCPMDRPVASGAGCYCLGNGAQRVWGRAS